MTKKKSDNLNTRIGRPASWSILYPWSTLTNTQEFEYTVFVFPNIWKKPQMYELQHTLDGIRKNSYKIEISQALIVRQVLELFLMNI